MAASATLIAGSLAGLNIHVLGFTDWPLWRSESARDQVLPAAEARVVGVLATGTLRRSDLLDSPAREPARAIGASGGEVRSADGLAATDGGGAPGGAPGGVVNVAASLSGNDAAGAATTRGGGTGVRPRGPVAHAAADSDGDGLPDAREERIGTDPQRSDTDGDGVPDAFEVDHGLDPRATADAASDPDVDGVNNRNEYLVKFDPQKPDTNEDGVSDGEDDSDGDGLPNAVEQKLGLNPSTAVTRGAASGPIPVVGSGGPGAGGTAARAPIAQSDSKSVVSPAASGPRNDGDLDSDGDGFTNAAEVDAGTDPADPTSHPPKPPPDPPAPDPPAPAPPLDPAPPPDPAPPVDPAPVDPGPVDPGPVDPGPVDPGPTDPTDPVPDDPPPADPTDTPQPPDTTPAPPAGPADPAPGAPTAP